MNDERGGTGGRGFVRDHRDLEVYRISFEAAMRIFRATRAFPREETYSLTDQVLRSSRSVCANLAEAWRKRRYRAAFIARLSDAEAEAAETVTWIQFAHACEYLDRESADGLATTYDRITGMLVKMIRNPDSWLIR